MKLLILLLTNLLDEEFSNKQITQQPKKIEQLHKTSLDKIPLNSLFEEFESFVGLTNLKQSLKRFYYISGFC